VRRPCHVRAQHAPRSSNATPAPPRTPCALPPRAAAPVHSKCIASTSFHAAWQYRQYQTSVCPPHPTLSLPCGCGAFQGLSQHRSLRAEVRADTPAALCPLRRGSIRTSPLATPWRSRSTLTSSPGGWGTCMVASGLMMEEARAVQGGPILKQFVRRSRHTHAATRRSTHTASPASQPQPGSQRRPFAGRAGSDLRASRQARPEGLSGQPAPGERGPASHTIQT
jgi:hypothetical protein